MTHKRRRTLRDDRRIRSMGLRGQPDQSSLSNALVESVITKIRLLTRLAFEFRSATALIALALLSPEATDPSYPPDSTHRSVSRARNVDRPGPLNLDRSAPRRRPSCKRTADKRASGRAQISPLTCRSQPSISRTSPARARGADRSLGVRLKSHQFNQQQDANVSASRRSRRPR